MAYIKFKELRINLGKDVLPYEDYVSPQVLTAESNGIGEGGTSLSPVTTLISNNNDVTINCEYMQIREYPLYGKKIVNFGDSIFGNYKAPLDISSFLAEYTGATVYNVGFGGTRMSSHAEYWNTLSMFSFFFSSLSAFLSFLFLFSNVLFAIIFAFSIKSGT